MTAADGEGSGHAALVGAVKLLAVDEGAAIVALDGIAGGRLGAVALLLNFVLQAARGELRLPLWTYWWRGKLRLPFYFLRLRSSFWLPAWPSLLFPARVIAALASSSVIRSLSPARASFNPRERAAESTSMPSRFKSMGDVHADGVAGFLFLGLQFTARALRRGCLVGCGGGGRSSSRLRRVSLLGQSAGSQRGAGSKENNGRGQYFCHI